MGGDTTLSFSLLLFLRSMPAGCEGDVNATQLLSLALLSVLAAHAQVIKPGRCPRPAVQQKFDANWPSVNALNRSANSCVLPGFLAHGMKSRGCSDGADVAVDSISGTAVAKGPSEPAKLAVSFYETKKF